MTPFDDEGATRARRLAALLVLRGFRSMTLLVTHGYHAQVIATNDASDREWTIAALPAGRWSVTAYELSAAGEEGCPKAGYAGLAAKRRLARLTGYSAQADAHRAALAAHPWPADL